MAKGTYQIVDYLTSRGAKGIFIDTNHPHPRIYFIYRGVRRFLVVPATGSDWRAYENQKRDVNHLLTDIDNITPDYDDYVEQAKDVRVEFAVPETFGERLQFAREQQQFTRSYLAQVSSVDEAIISSLETNKAEETDLATLMKLSTALHLSLAYLTGSNEQYKEIHQMSDMGRRVQEQRQSKNLTIGMLAANTGIPVQQLANLETGAWPDFNRLPEVAKALGTTEEWLREGRGGPQIYSDIKTLADFGAYIKYLRTKQGWGQKELADKIGPAPGGGKVYATEISKIETGIKFITWLREKPDKLAYMLDVPLEDMKAIIANLEVKPDRRFKDVKAPKLKPFAPEVKQPEPQPVPPSPVQQLTRDTLLSAIHMEGTLTRELLAEQHRELLDALKNVSSGNLATVLHALIDQFFTKR